MKALILTVSTGQGHNSAASAVQEELEGRGAECCTLDVCYYVSRLLGDTVSNGYLLAANALSGSYSSIYKRLEKRKKNSHSPIVGFFSMLASHLYGFVSEFSPDVIICTHVFAAITAKELKRKHGIGAYILGIVTDFTVHPYWEEVTELDFLVIPSQKLVFQCLKKGFKGQQLLPFGIPLRKEMQKRVSKAEARRALGLYSDRPVITVMGGSMGYGSVAETVKRIDALEKCFQIVAVCGSSRKEYRALCRNKLFHKVLRLGYTSSIPMILDASDCLVTKPGGLSVSEALAKGVPLVLTEPIPGHEERNEGFILNSGAAMCATKGTSAEEVVWLLTTDADKLKYLTENAGRCGIPDSSKKLGDFIENLIMRHDK